MKVDEGDGHITYIAEKRNAQKILLVKPESIIPLTNLKHKWEINIKVILKEIRLERVLLNHLSDDRTSGWVLRKTLRSSCIDCQHFKKDSVEWSQLNVKKQPHIDCHTNSFLMDLDSRPDQLTQKFREQNLCGIYLYETIHVFLLMVLPVS